MSLTRRDFLAGGTIAGSAALATGSIIPTLPDLRPRTPQSSAAATFYDLLRSPDFVTAYDGPNAIPLNKSNGIWNASGISVKTEPHSAAEKSGSTSLAVSLSAPQHPVSRLHLRWQMRVTSGLRLLSDHWERGYGDLEWRGLVGERVMPWYFLTYDGARTHGYGISTQPNAMAFWRVDNAGVSLWLDVRNGGSPVMLGERTLELCRVVTREGHEGESGWQAARAFCGLMCDVPRMPVSPVFGGNNWYYAYGENCSAKAIERDAGLLAELAGATTNRPFQVIDDGWQLTSVNNGCCSGGPWRYGNAGFPDMPGLATRLKSIGVRPGIWMRPLLTHERGTESLALKKPQPPGREGRVLDPTILEVVERIRSDIAGLVAWGYQLVKHDFSTYDLFGRWGPRMGAALTDEGWSFHDRSRTTAEVVKDLYRTIRAGAGDKTVIIGCNTIGHLSAGLFELQRCGDDTSGKQWEKTRRMGVNTLAFRGVQHGTFFAADADCVGLTKDVPWTLNKQWLDLLSRSGTPLFVSAAPEAVGAEQRKALREAFAKASIVQAVAEPLDWLDTTTPERWRCEGETVTYDWYGATGDTSDVVG